MPRFLVTPESQPGLGRADLGLVRPGTIFEWPFATPNDLPSLKLRPVDKEAYELLVKTYSKEAVEEKWGEFKPFVAEKPAVEVPKSPAELAHNLEAGSDKLTKKTSKRLSDK